MIIYYDQRKHAHHRIDRFAIWPNLLENIAVIFSNSYKIIEKLRIWIYIANQLIGCHQSESLTDGIIAPAASTTLAGLRSSHMLHFQIDRRRSQPGRQTRLVIIRRGAFHGEASPRQGSGIEGSLLFGAIRLLGRSSVAPRPLRVLDCNNSFV